MLILQLLQIFRENLQVGTCFPFSRQGYGEALGNKVGGGISLSPLVVSLEDTKAQARPLGAP